MIQSVWKNLTGLQKAAEHLWCDFKWDTNSSPNTNDLYIWYSHFIHFKTVATEVEIFFLKYINFFVGSLDVPLSLLLSI